MKFVVAGDTHMSLRHCQYLIGEASKRKLDRIFVVGDFGYFEHLPYGAFFLDILNTYANVKNVLVYFLDGNHDKTSMILALYSDFSSQDTEGFLKVRPYIRYARRGHRWSWDGCRFIALGGAYSIDKSVRLFSEKKHGEAPGTSWFPEEEMTDEDMDLILKDTEPVDVMLAHDKPRCSDPGWHRREILECGPNQDRLQRAVEVLDPRLYVHGHLHWPYIQQVQHSVVGQDGPGVMRVIGLDCDSDAGGQKLKSWFILDTEEYLQ